MIRQYDATCSFERSWYQNPFLQDLYYYIILSKNVCGWKPTINGGNLQKLLCLNIFVEKPKLFRRIGQFVTVCPISKKKRFYSVVFFSSFLSLKNASQLITLKKVKAIITKARISFRPPFVHSIWIIRFGMCHFFTNINYYESILI